MRSRRFVAPPDRREFMAMTLGVNCGPSAANCEVECAKAAEAGATYVRFSVESTWSDWVAELQRIKAACDANGLKLWNTLQGMPARFSATGRDGHFTTHTQAGWDYWASYAVLCAEIGCNVIGGGNENNGFGQGPGQLPDPQGMAEMTLAAAEALNSVLPNGTWHFTTPELCPASGTDFSKDTYIEPLLYFQKMIQAQPAILHQKRVWIGWHPYCDFRYPATTVAGWNQAYRMRALDAYLGTLHHPSKRIVAGEFGAASGSTFAQAVSPTDQAQRLTDYWAEFTDQNDNAGVFHGPMLWYRLQDTKPMTPDDWTAYCGLYDRNWGRKPVWTVFNNICTGNGPAPTYNDAVLDMGIG